MKNNQGFTLVEFVVALAVVSVVSVAAVGLLFSSLSVRDQTLATDQTEEAIRTFNRQMDLAGRNAKTVSGGGTSLFTAATNDCWSFVWNSATKVLNYSHQTTPGCTPTANPSQALFPVDVKIESLNFTITSLATGGREISLTANVHTFKPFADYAVDFSNTIINLVD